MIPKEMRKLIEEANATSDSVFRSKFVHLPHYVSQWLKDFGGLDGKRIMDFGCGLGTTAASIALTRSPAAVLGVDINDEHKACLADLRRHVSVAELPPNLAFERVLPGEMPSEGNFDIIYSWSVFEHIDKALYDDVLRKLRDQLAGPGFLFVQIAPLYYSSEGSHLARYGLANWEHLTSQLNHVQKRVFSAEGISAEEKNCDWGCFMTLNKVTVDDVVSAVINNGFALERLYMTKEEKLPPEELTRVFREEALTTNQMVALFRKVPDKSDRNAESRP